MSADLYIPNIEIPPPPSELGLGRIFPLGSAPGSSVGSDGDLATVGTSVYVRSGGSWSAISGGGGSVTGTAPITVSGGVVSMAKSTSSVNGYLAAADFKVFAGITTALNVKNYGALGDGSTDDTTAIQACITAAHAAGTATTSVGVYFPTPSNFYKITSALTFTKQTTFYGDGMLASTIKQVTNAANAFTVSTAVSNVVFYGLTIQGSGLGSSTGTGVSAVGGQTYDSWLVQNCKFTGWGTAFRGTAWEDSVILNCFFNDNTTGLYFDGNSNSNVILQTSVGCSAGSSGSGYVGIRISNGRSWTIIGGDFASVTMDIALLIDGASYVYMEGCNIERNVASAVVVDGLITLSGSLGGLKMVNCYISATNTQNVYPVLQSAATTFECAGTQFLYTGKYGGHVKHLSSINTTTIDTIGQIQVDVFNSGTYVASHRASPMPTVSGNDGTVGSGNTRGKFRFYIAGATNGDDALLWDNMIHATATGAHSSVATFVINAAGSSYVVGDTITGGGGTEVSSKAKWTVSSVGGGGAVTGLIMTNAGDYSADPSTSNTPTGGTGTGLTLTLTLGYFIRDNLNQYNLDRRANTVIVTNYAQAFSLLNKVNIYGGGTTGINDALWLGGGDDNTNGTGARLVMSCATTGKSDTAVWRSVEFQSVYDTGTGFYCCDAVFNVNTGGSQTSVSEVLRMKGSNLATVAAGDIKVGTVGKGIYVKEGSNATMGTGTLNGTTEVTISTNKVTANSRIFLSIQTPHGTPVGSIYVSSRSAGSSFGVKGTVSDTSDFAWMIVEPA